MEIVTVTRKYQVTIPSSVREKLGIRVGDKLRVRVEGGKIVMEPLFERRGNPLEELLSIFEKPLDINAVKLVEETWDEY